MIELLDEVEREKKNVEYYETLEYMKLLGIWLVVGEIPHDQEATNVTILWGNKCARMFVSRSIDRV